MIARSKYRVLLLVAAAGCLYILIQFLKPSRAIVESLDFSQIVYDRNGTVLRIALADDEKYRIHTHVDANPLLKEAILLKEDRYFYYHPGVNPVSLLRAFYQTFLRDRKIGGSTITMQVARLRYNLNTRTIPGKIKQILYALFMELSHSKNEILEAYLNIAPCGGNIEGFAPASLIYFGKDITDLTLQEILFLSVLPQNPSAFHAKTPSVENGLAEARQCLFKVWRERHGDSTAAPFDMPLNIGYDVPFHAPHYTTALLQKYDREQKIYGTIDLQLQETVTRLTSRYIQRQKHLGVYNAAVLLVDADNMHVLASLGSADFFDDEIQGQVNGVRSRRSPGSTLKPFIYALAMEQGLIHPMTMLKDAPTSFSEYSPDNYEGDFKGPVKAWEALVTSRNVPAVALASQIKEPDLYDFLYKAGVGNLQDKAHYGLSIVLGSAELSMVELVALYGILANDGVYRELADSYESEEDRAVRPRRLLSKEVCYLVKDILRKNPRPSSGNAAMLQEVDLPVAYKTGTSIGFKDCWAIGLFGHYILAVWLGNFDGYGNPVFNGRSLAAPLMFEIIDSIAPHIEKSTKISLPPERITRIDVCAVSGQIAHPHCLRQIPTLYIAGKSPIAKCRICREIYVDTRTGYRTFRTDGPSIKKQVVEFWPTDLLALFKKAGIPRQVPPPFDPRESLAMLSTTGIPPEILSPLKDTEYILSRSDAAFNDLPLLAHADADVQEVYWFVDEKYIGKAHPDETRYWSLAPGVFKIGVIDDHGRSDYREIRISVDSK
ncbi:penicillin-binding protein 1C [candidate division KSB1 bacterium RBG_16_48_16]|nr:MAG: penicillin-binding protein 1C [candidate division KSB1 bacterium RBG_16_48_16]